jgi:integrase
MTQLRKEDVREQDGISYIRITPEAGSVKTGQYRDVPLHPHLIELGFLDFVAAARDGALFFSGRANPDARHLSKIVASRVSNWIRSLDVISPDVAPNHGWRHRFKTVGIEAGMHGRALDAIQG